MGRGLSKEQRGMLEYVGSNNFEEYVGCRVYIWNPDQSSPNGAGSAEEWRQYRIDCASLSRTLHRLIDRGMLEKHRVIHYWSGEGRYGSVQLFSLTVAGLAALVEQRKSNGYYPPAAF